MFPEREKRLCFMFDEHTEHFQTRSGPAWLNGTGNGRYMFTFMIIYVYQHPPTGALK